MYGDSIMETLRGTDHGLPCGRAGCPEGPSILRAHFGARWRTAIVATGGGDTDHRHASSRVHGIAHCRQHKPP